MELPPEFNGLILMGINKMGMSGRPCPVANRGVFMRKTTVAEEGGAE
jgi:hypothetical protein